MMREKTPLDEFVCFQIEIKDFWLEVMNYFSDKLPLSQKLCYFTEGAVSHNVLYYSTAPNARCQVSF